MRAVTTNIKYSDRPDGFERAVKRVRLLLPEDGSPDLWVFQEANGCPTEKMERVLGPRWEVYRQTTTAGAANGTAVAWRDDIWEKVKAGVKVIYDPPKDGAYESYHGELKKDWKRFATHVTLKHRKTGEVVSLVSVHGKLGSSEKLKTVQWRHLLGLLDALSAMGAVLVGGDFNDRIGGALKIVPEAGYKKVESTGIDSFFSKNLQTKRTATYSREQLDPVMDHPAIWVEVEGKGVTPGPNPAKKLLFNVATWNLLGASHTDPKNKEHYAKKWLPWDKRLPAQVTALKATKASIMGLQECQAVQAQALKKEMPNFAWEMGTVSKDNWIAWDKTVWEKIKDEDVLVPYFGGNEKGMPLVLLRHRETDQLFWVLNCHNPANVRGPAAHFRAEAVRRECAALKEAVPSAAFLFLGDFNEGRSLLLKQVRKIFPGAHLVGAKVDHIVARRRTKLSPPSVNRPNSGKASDHPLVSTRVAHSYHE